MTWIMTHHDGNWHLTKHIPAVSTSYCDTMHTMLACALVHSMKLSALKFSPISFTPAFTQGTIHDVLISLLYKCQETPLHHGHSWPLLPIIFQKQHNYLKSFRTNPTTWHPIFQHLPSAGNFFLTLSFSDLMPEI